MRGACPGAKSHHIVDCRWIANYQRHRIDADAMQPSLAKQRGHSMRQGTMPERMVSAKSQHPPREVLIGKFQYLGVVVGIDDYDAASRLRDTHHFAQRAMGLLEVLEHTICAASVE